MCLILYSILCLVTSLCLAVIDGNPFEGYNVLANPDFTPLASQVDRCAASKGTFYWVTDYGNGGKLPSLSESVKNASSKTILPIVVYGLPGRDCSAASSAGGSSGLDTYYGLIDSIKRDLDPDIRTVFVLEPDALGNLITYGQTPSCQAAGDTYKEGIAYALKTLNGNNTAIYVDAGNSAWLGEGQKISSLTNIIVSLWEIAGKPKSFRGLSTNVSNYRLWQSSVTSKRANKYSDESTYVSAFATSMANAGLEAHFITDTSRNGVAISATYGFPCNIEIAGLGPAFTTETGNPHEDAFVWIKTPGMSDGTSDPTAPNYDMSCSSEVSMGGAPAAGQWFKDYFQALVQHANPKLACSR
ncbi:MAG: hypothetical protein Q9167_001459 [Letrouitia subvulpina]